jgi:ubiquinone biosynthesis protein
MKKMSFSASPLNMLARIKDPDQIRSRLAEMARMVGVDNFRSRAAKEIVAETRPQMAVPEIYRPYRPLVRDGIEFFLAHLPLQRLMDVVVSQLQMDSESSTEERLLELAKQFPTLHKLGQIIARNPNLEPGMKQWLIQLESGSYGTAPGDLLDHIQNRLNPKDAMQPVDIEPFILSEASVGAVIPFRQQGCHGVFKVLKPGIESSLAEELEIFESMATYFDSNRHRYELGNFQFLRVFDDVREILGREIDLQAEQSHLAHAAKVYEDTREIVIPELIALSDETMTAMAYIPGDKISDAKLTEMQRRECAQVLAESLICRPIFAVEEPALFHGDPHAGNILMPEDDGTGEVRIALLDWSLAGHLTRKVRIKIVRLIQSILAENSGYICRCLQDLAENDTGEAALSRTALWRRVSGWIETPAYARFSLMRKAFWLLEQLSYEGVVFAPDLMLFRKAIFTLEGVLYDLYPRFNLDAVVFKFMAGLLAEEIPRRIGNLMFFQADKPENYRSLLSNGDLHSLAMRQYTAAIKRHTRATADLMERQVQIVQGLFN